VNQNLFIVASTGIATDTKLACQKRN